MARDITPISQMRQRIPEGGRIRIGKLVPNAKSRTGFAPAKIGTFRFTSASKPAIEQLAERYGGRAQPWVESPVPNHWEVETLATEIPVVLPPECLGDTPVYEQWNKGGLLRRCDGETCLEPKQRGDDFDMVPTPCICRAKGTEDCDAKIRLQVLLREIRFVGAWLLTSGGWNAALELPGMVGMIYAMQDSGLPTATLRLVERRSVRFGKTRIYNVPVLSVDSTVDELAAGLGVLGVNSLGSGADPGTRALGAGDPDNEPAEATIVWDPLPIVDLGAQVVTRWNEAHKAIQTTTEKFMRTLAVQVSGDESIAFEKLSHDQAERVATLLEEILDGTVEITAVEQYSIRIRRLGQ